MNQENQNYDPTTVNTCVGASSRREVPVAEMQIPDCWHVAMATAKGLGRDTILDTWHLAHDYRDKVLRLSEARASTTDDHFIVETYTVADGWINTWQDDDNPALYDTADAAKAALDDFFEDLAEAKMQGYSRAEYRIVKVSREVIQ